MSDADTSKAAVEWPREIWMAERDDHDQGIVSAVLSEHATVARWAGDSERDKEYHHYIDMDVYDSAEKYHAARYDALAAEREALVEAERLCRADFHQMRIANDKLRVQLAEAQAQAQTARNDALREAAKLAWDMDAKYLRKQYVVDHNRKRYDISGVERCENKTANVISEDIHNAILALIDKDTTQ